MNDADFMRTSQETQRARTAMKANFNESSLANDLLIGHQIETGKSAAETTLPDASLELGKTAEARLVELPGEIEAKKKELVALKVQSDLLKDEFLANAESMVGMKAKLQELGRAVDPSVLAEHEANQAAINAKRLSIKQTFEKGKAALEDLNNEQMFHEAVRTTNQ